MNKLVVAYLDDILESIDLIGQYVHETPEIHFSQNKQLQDSVIRRLVIIGEAAGKIPTDIREQAPDVPWRTIIGFRNVAIHDYASVHMGRVWEIIQTELSVLKKQITTLRSKNFP